MIDDIKLPGNRIFRVEHDDNPEDPREWSNLGTMVCFHRRYCLGDANKPFSSDQFDSWAEMEDYIWKDLDAAVVLPLYLYDHSGITMNTTGFSCRWDSGQVGFIYVTKDRLRKEYGVKRIRRELKEKVEKILVSEVHTYDQFISGDVYRFEIVKVESCDHGHNHEEYEDSCGGFYGYDIKKNGMLDHISEEDANIILGQL